MNTQFEFVEALQSKFAIEHVKDNLRVNLSQMAKPFGGSKKPSFWLRSNEAQKYLEQISELRFCNSKGLIQVIHGGNIKLQGTWCNDFRIAMRFAQWLSPKFSLMVDTLLVNLLTKQVVIAEPIAGIWPLIYNGIIGYPRKEILEASGYSSRSGSNSHRRKKYPEHHLRICRTSCITAWLARRVHEMGKERQLSLFGYGAVLTCGN